MKERTRLKYNGFSYTDSQLHQIGNQVASLWGASCYDYKLDRKEEAVLFYCIEYGEKFIAKTCFSELAGILGGK